METFYQKLIRELEAAGNARWIEAWMRLGHAGLGEMTREEFAREVAVGLACSRAVSEEHNNCLASSFGL